jgi:hypothetical protein
MLGGWGDGSQSSATRWLTSLNVEPEHTRYDFVALLKEMDY